MNFKGTVIYLGQPKEFLKGWSVGFKINTFEEFLNIFEDTEAELKDKIIFKAGDAIEGTYEKGDKYNVIKTIHKLAAAVPQPSFQSADTIEYGDIIIDKNIALTEKIFEKAQNTKWFQFFLLNKDTASIQKQITTIYLSSK